LQTCIIVVLYFTIYITIYFFFFFFFFFFQAEDGIRDRNVTGVQTCALPIYIFFVVYFCHIFCLHICSVECSCVNSLKNSYPSQAQMGLTVLHSPHPLASIIVWSKESPLPNLGN